MKTLLFQVKKELHDKLAKAAAKKRMYRPDFYAICLDLGLKEIERKEFLYTLAGEISEKFDLNEYDTEHKAEVEFKFKEFNCLVDVTVNPDEYSVHAYTENLDVFLGEEEVERFAVDDFELNEILNKFR